LRKRSFAQLRKITYALSMSANFLTVAQRENYGRYAGDPSPEVLSRYFHLSDSDRDMVSAKRGKHNRLGFALQLTTARFLGTFLEDPANVPGAVVSTVCHQLDISPDCLSDYRNNRQRWAHMMEIRAHEGFRDFSDPGVGFRLTCWLYTQCWTGTDRPGMLFERATLWMLANKVLLPGASVLERFVSRLRQRIATRVWQRLGNHITSEHRARLDALLVVPEGSRTSWLDQLRTGPVMASGPALVQALHRLQRIRDLGMSRPVTASIPASRIAALARFANVSKATAVAKLPPARRLATLAAFVHTLEASAQDDVLEILEMVLHELFVEAERADRTARMRRKTSMRSPRRWRKPVPC